MGETDAAVNGNLLLMPGQWPLYRWRCLDLIQPLIQATLDALQLHRRDAANGFKSERKLHLVFGVEQEILLFAGKYACFLLYDLAVGQILQRKRPCHHARCLAHADINRGNEKQPQVRKDEASAAA